MKYFGMPLGMWLLYKQSFRDNLVSVLGFSDTEADETIKSAKPRYKKIIGELPEFVPAMCHLDYTMNDMGGTSTFVRKYTLASGGQYCGCGYKKK